MRVFHILPGSVSESSTLPMVLPEKGYLWIACGRREFEVEQGAVQSTLQVLCGMTLVDLHISDLLNNQLPSHYDYTSQYDLLVFRRLAQGRSDLEADPYSPSLERLPRRGGIVGRRTLTELAHAAGRDPNAYRASPIFTTDRRVTEKTRSAYLQWSNTFEWEIIGNLYRVILVDHEIIRIATHCNCLSITL